MKKQYITILGPMPPLKGISQYLEGFVKALSQEAAVQVLSFHDMYPKSLYPGGSYKDTNKKIDSYPDTTISHSINRWNPITQIKAGLSIQGSILHMQYRVRFLAPVYITIALIARYIKHIPVCITIHNVIPHEQSGWKLLIDKIVYKTADLYIVHSLDNKKQLQHIIGKNKEITIFPHGIIIHPHEKIDTIQAKTNLSIDSNKTVLLLYGHIRPYKGLHYLLESLYELVQKDPTYHLIIAGQCREDRGIYESQITSLGLSPYITRIEGFVSEEQSAILFSASNLLVLPYTHFDAQSGVIALGLGYEIPILVSNLGGLTEIIDQKDCIFEPGNSASLTECIIRNRKVDHSDYIHNLKNTYSRDRIVNKYLVYMKNHAS